MNFKIIDSHMHLGPSTGRMVLDVSVESLIALMDRLEIERCISANELTLKDQFEAGLEDDRIAYEKSGGRVFSFFGYSANHSQQALDCIRAHAGDPRCRAIKLHPAGSKTNADDERYRPVWEIAKELHLPIMSHTWDVSSYNPTQAYAFAGRFEKYIREYPEVTFVFGHSGGRYNGIKTAIELGKKYPNTYFDIAGDIWPYGFLEEMVENLGADRIVYGSDWAMIEQRPMLGVVFGANISNLDKEKILRHTSARIYFNEE